MSGFRQQLAGMNRRAVEGVIANEDEQYGKQLATMFERYGLQLRSIFGGQPLWAPQLKRHLRAKQKGDTE